MCCLRYAGSFLGVFISDPLPQQPIARSSTLIVNTDPYTESGSHWLTIHLQSRSHIYFFFDIYGLPPFIPSIQSFINRNIILRNYNTVQLQGPTSTFCGKYRCLFAMYMDRGYKRRQFVGLLTTASTDRAVSVMFASEFVPYEVCPVEGSVAFVALRGTYVRPISYYTRNAYSFSLLVFLPYSAASNVNFCNLFEEIYPRGRLFATQSTSRWRLYHVKHSLL